MRYRLTFIAGVALGYVLGTRAGRERYEQLKKAAQQLAENPAVRNAAESAAHGGRDFMRQGVPLGEREGGGQGPRVRLRPGALAAGAQRPHRQRRLGYDEHLRPFRAGRSARHGTGPRTDRSSGAAESCPWA